jgi:opacity protein-like surface antigen
MNKLMLGVMVMGAAVAAPALADNASGPYVGGGFGRFDLKIHNLNDVGQSVDTIADSNDNAWKVFAGWRMSPFFALEAAYVDLGNPGNTFSATGSSGRYQMHVAGFTPSVIGTLPLGPVELFAKAGYYYYNVKLRADVTSLANTSVSSSHSRSDFTYGAGVGMTFAEHLNVRGEYERIKIGDYGNSDALWLDAAWRF